MRLILRVNDYMTILYKPDNYKLDFQKKKKKTNINTNGFFPEQIKVLNFYLLKIKLVKYNDR